jgi:hypothetical protein
MRTHITLYTRVVTHSSKIFSLSMNAGQSHSHGEFSTASGMKAAYTGMALRVSSGPRYRDRDGVGKFHFTSSGRPSDFSAAAQSQPAF